MRILIVEDDARLADVLRRSLTEHGHVVDLVYDGESGEASALASVYDCIVLDVMLPKQDGLTIARKLRNVGNVTPILMLTARDTTEEIVAGLDAGADDYLGKPFELAELEARLRSVFRRRAVNPGKVILSHGVELDLSTMQVRRDGREIALSTREIAFLEYFLRHSDQVLTRAMIEDALWDEQRNSGSSNIIDVYIGRLRAKLTTESEPQLLHTIRGAGYRFGMPI